MTVMVGRVAAGKQVLEQELRVLDPDLQPAGETIELGSIWGT